MVGGGGTAGSVATEAAEWSKAAGASQPPAGGEPHRCFENARSPFRDLWHLKQWYVERRLFGLAGFGVRKARTDDEIWLDAAPRAHSTMGSIRGDDSAVGKEPQWQVGRARSNLAPAQTQPRCGLLEFGELKVAVEAVNNQFQSKTDEGSVKRRGKPVQKRG